MATSFAIDRTREVRDYDPRGNVGYPLLDADEGHLTHDDGLPCLAHLVGPARGRNGKYVFECPSTGNQYVCDYWPDEDEITLDRLQQTY